MSEALREIYDTIRARAGRPSPETRVRFDDPPHPWYGPCDAFGGNGQWCSECRRVMEDQEEFLNFIKAEFDRHLSEATDG